ncbi:MAG: response regulator transcription factor [Cyclobacteriaceae bacterium]
MSARVLLVEDDPGLGYVVKDALDHKNYTVTLCVDGESALESFSTSTFDLCILDVMLPRKDGFALAKAIREKNKNIPIIFVTAKGMMEDKASGFQSGGDDYLTKPFSIEELCYRMEVFLRRANGASNEDIYTIGQYVFNTSKLELACGSDKITLTQKEAEVLKQLCIHQERVLKRDEILKSVWGDDDYFMGRSMDVFISRLRKHLKQDPHIQIVNYHGVGFKLEIEKSQPSTSRNT